MSIFNFFRKSTPAVTPTVESKMSLKLIENLKPGTYTYDVFKQLDSGKIVSTDSIYQDFRTHDGRKILSVLKLKYGVPIKCKELEAKNGKKPRKIHWLDKDIAA